MPENEGKSWFLRLTVLLSVIAACYYFFYSRLPEVQNSPAIPASTVNSKVEHPVASLSDGNTETVSAYIKSEKISDLSTMIRQDRYCEFAAFKRKQFAAGEQKDNFIDEYLALRNANEQAPLPCRGALFAPNGKVALEFARQDKSISCLFLQGLLLGNFLQGVSIGIKGAESIEQLNESTALFEYLQAKNPDNGIYSFFLLPLLQKLHRPIEESDKSFRRFLSARDFDNPLTLYGIEILALGAINPSAYINAETLLTNMHIPDYHESFHVAQELARDPNFARDLESWTSRFLSNLEKVERDGLPEPYVWPIEIMALRRFASIAWQDQRPTVPLPEVLTDDRRRKLLKLLINHYFADLPVIEGSNPDLTCKAMIDTVHSDFISILSGEKQTRDRWQQINQKK